jgi:hypothetical protein
MEMDDADKPEFKETKERFPEALEGLIAEPPLLEGEDPAQFWSLFDAVVEEQKPQTITDWISAMDMAIKCWEELRLKRSSAALINTGILAALAYFFTEIKPSSTMNNWDLKLRSKPPSDFALQYFSKRPNDRAEVMALLAQHGITIVHLQAKAAEFNKEPLLMFERMIASRENGRRQLRKEATQRKAGRPSGE